MEKELLGQNIKKLYYNISILYMSNTFKPIDKKVDCNAPRTSPLFSWALCGMTGREKSEGKKSNIKTSPLTVPVMKKGKGGRKKSRKRKKKKRTKKRKGGKKRRKTRRKKKTRRRRRK